MTPSATNSVLFDLDGTLSDPSQGILECFNQTLTDLGRTPLSSDELRSFVGPPLEECFSQILKTDHAQQISQAVLTFRECYGQGGLFKNHLYPGIKTLLKSLKDRGWNLFVVTSKKEAFARRILHHFKIYTFFTDVIGVKAGKPSGKDFLIAELMKRHTLPGSHTIMIGDRSHDILGAQANNIDSYGVLWGFGSREELENAKAKRIFTDIDDLHSFFMEQKPLPC